MASIFSAHTITVR